MPIYEYACEKCGKITERIQKVTDRAPRKCESCGGKLSKVMSRSSFQLKGGGWYKDLYSSAPEKKGGSTENKGGSSDGSRKVAPVEAKTTSKIEGASPAKEAKPAKPAKAEKK
jgi:putative FmdB family regulatory protein